MKAARSSISRRIFLGSSNRKKCAAPRFRPFDRQTQSFSSTNGSGGSGTFQSPEYPWATEPPVITKTTAAQAAAGQPVTAVPVPGSASTTSTASTTPPLKQQQQQQEQQQAATSPFSLFGNLFSSSPSTSPSSSSTPSSPASQEEDKENVDQPTTETTTASTSSLHKHQGPTSFSDYIKRALGLYKDPFDDEHTLSDDEKERIRQHQKTELAGLVLQSEPITTQAPAYMARATHPDISKKTETIITTLDNGLRIVSLDLAGSPVASLGMVSQLGSRSEKQLGTTNLLEMCAFGATEQYPTGVAEMVQAWGSGSPMGVTGREQSLLCLDVWQPHVEDAVAVLASMASAPLFSQEDVDEGRQVLAYQADPAQIAVEVFLSEALHEAAYGADQQLGKRHFCLDKDQLQNLTPQILMDHWRSHITNNPQGVVVGCAGTRHDDFVAMVDRHFGHLQQQTDLSIVKSTYKGGECKILVPTLPSIDPKSEIGKDRGLTRVAVAWPTGGWHADDFVPACVLQSLLGGGSSFSAGGPGKGMYSRLYRTVLNRYNWAESAEATTAYYNDAGLMGFAGSCPPQHARDLTKLFCQHMQWLAQKPVEPEELLRAKNMLRCNVLIQLESRLVMFEDITRQVLTFGRHEPMSVTAERIEAVTARDLQNLAERMLRFPPALAAAGVDLSTVPTREELCGWLK
jgi:mitochondrial-processing peptidase subunit alpha